MGTEAEDRGDAVVDEEIVEEQVVEEKVEAEAKDEDKSDEKDEGKFVPKGRFDKAVEKEREARKAAEARELELRSQLRKQGDDDSAAKVEEEISALEDKLDQAIADGDADAKKAIRAQIREKTQGLAEARAAKQAAYATALAVEKVQYANAVQVLEAQFPQMNPDADEFDQEVVGELLELKEAYEAKGMGSTDAIKKAAKYVFRTAPAEVKKEAAKKEATEAEKAEAADKAAKLKEEAIKRGLAAKGKQPPVTQSGKSSDKGGQGAEANVAKMTDKDFAKLPDDEKARLRGDFV